MYENLERRSLVTEPGGPVWRPLVKDDNELESNQTWISF